MSKCRLSAILFGSACVAVWALASDSMATTPMTAAELTLFDTSTVASPNRPAGFSPLELSNIDWDGLLDQKGGEKIKFGVELQGPSPYSRNAGTPFKPASNTKLFTSAAALALLGPDYRIQTRLSWAGINGKNDDRVGGLELVGFGDPTWGMAEFGETIRSRVEFLAKALYASGVRQVLGPLIVKSSDPRWNDLAYPEGWMTEDHVACYGALAQSFNLAENCGTFLVSSRSEGSWLEEGITVPVELNIESGSRTQLHVVASDVGRRFKISGTLVPGKRAAFYLPVHDNLSRIRILLIDALKRAGIDYDPDASPTPRGERSVVILESPRLGDLIRPFMKHSLNFMGAALIRILGQVHGDPKLDLLSAGRQVMMKFIAQIGTRTALHVGIEPRPGFFVPGVMLYDGSGISHHSRVTTGAVMALLRDLLLEDEFTELWDSLPIAGVDGTLRYRMRGTPAQGVLRAKTGTLSGVYNLSGYVPRYAPDGTISEFIPFVMLSSAVPGSSVPARAAQDRVGAALAKLINPSRDQSVLNRAAGF